MYAYIKGIVSEVRPSHIVLENNEIGYLIIVPNPYNYQVGNHETIYLYHHVREDVFSLYGFRNNQAKELFIKLISVSGVGPKTALSIMAASNLDLVVRAIENNDYKYLTKFPGIGNKTAQQIILDLSGKLVIDDIHENSVLVDVELALLALGYSKKDIVKVLKQVDEALPLEQAIKEALRLIVGWCYGKKRNFK